MLIIGAGGYAVISNVGHHPALPGDTKTQCLYSQHSITALREFTTLTHRPIDCALVYNDAAPDWAAWDNPWFLSTTNPDKQWARWKTQSPDRRLVIAPGIVPQDVPDDWRARGASGEYDNHFHTLAAALINAGLGDSIIRLAHEGNGEWFHDWFGPTAINQQAWRTYWRRAVLAMRTTPGAHFTFDWNIAAGFDTVPLSWYYPGDDVVDIIGFDYYDLDIMANGATAHDPHRWTHQYTRHNGPADLIAFANQHNKPLSIPEWGLVPTHTAHPGGGDNPAFVHGIAAIVHNHRVTYSGYFNDPVGGTRLPLAAAPNSLTGYQQEFGKAP